MQRLRVFRSRFFWKLYLTYSALFLCINTLIAWQVYSQLKRSLKDELQRSLQDKLAILSSVAQKGLAGSYEGDLTAYLKNIRSKTKTDFAIISPEGRIIAASEPPDIYTNLSEYPEFTSALSTGNGSAQRFDLQTKEPVVYFANRINNSSGQTIGVLRGATPLSVIDDQLSNLRYSIVIISIFGMAAALIIGLVLAKRAAVPIAEMVRVCNAMRRGRYDRKVKTLPKDEIGRLGDTLNRLGSELTSQIATISLERAQLKTMLAGMVEGIIAVDDQMHVQFCNRAAYKLLNSDIKDCRGMHLDEVKGFDLLSEIAQSAKTKRELIEDELRIEANSHYRLLEIHASSFKGTGASGVIILLHDVTHIRKLERVRKDFVANVSHEIKTPLTSIKGYVETLLSGAIDDQEFNRKFLEKIESNANRLMNLVQDILSLARIESQEDVIGLKPTDWVPLAKQVLANYEDIFTEKRLEVKMNELNSPLVVMGDKNAMLQIVDNLVTNAIRYTPVGGKIILSLRKEPGHGVLEVEDTGIGIPRKDIGRIFERFYRVDKARSRELGGTGLGLSIVKHLVSSMDGQITVDSEVGMGSRFTVSLAKAN